MTNHISKSPVNQENISCFSSVNFIPLVDFCMTRFQLILPVDTQNVTKNHTGRRMRVEGPQMDQINCWNSSFQNMVCYRQQSTVGPGKSILYKKHLKIGDFDVQESELRDFGGTYTRNASN